MRHLRLADALLVLVLVAPAAAAGAAGGGNTPAAKAPAAPPAAPNVMKEMAKGGCKAFADLITASPDAASTYQSAVEGGVTVFCPSDDAVKAFMPKYKNLTADSKAELLLFHAVPVHYSLESLKSNNGPMNTLATDGAAKNYNFTLQNEGDVVTIKTAASAGAPARVKSTVLDRDPVAIYVIDAVVEPVELFKLAPSPTPAPSPAPGADAPKAARHPAPAVADAPGPAAADAPPEDQKKDARKSAAAGAPCIRWLAAALAAVVVTSALA
ncbi:fasciclin-like arabinogalactan protein 1 [Phragmites australis]|uniref:fasciclin-like arabinogalactan protein 1 n=1 Tax=Phragmites australis TaxID=29695 RepID=UPI002D78F841|nr:fasciclin-like arabinogalactan protein 1 [Phragmites australis]